MVLHREGRGKALGGFPPQAFHRVVIEVDVRDLDVGREAGCIRGIAMVVRADFHPACLVVENGLVRTTMTELEFVGLSAQGLRQYLMTHADSKIGILPSSSEMAFVAWVAIEGSPGPLERKSPSGWMLSTSRMIDAQSKCAGMTVSAQPRFSSSRTSPILIPKSNTATRYRLADGGSRVAVLGWVMRKSQST